jgi:PAS domain S-box-containing protein
MSDSVENTPAHAACDSSDAVSEKRLRQSTPVVLKLTLLVGVTLAVLLSGLLIAGWFYWRGVLHAQVDAHLGAVAASRCAMVRTQVALLQQRVELNTDRGELRGFFHELANGIVSEQNRAGSQQTLETISNGDPILSASLVDHTGQVVLSSEPGQVGRNVGAEIEFSHGLTGAHVGRPRRVGDRFEAVLAAPVHTRRDPGKIYGVLMVVADVSRLGAALRDVTGLGESGETLLGVRDGDRLLFLFPPKNSPQTTSVPLETAPTLSASTLGKDAFFRSRDYRGVPVLAAVRAIGYDGWALVVKIDESEAYAPIHRSLRWGVILGLSVAAIGLLAAYLVARSFTRPLRRLAAAASRVAGGDYDFTLPVRSADEIGALSVGFNEMTAAIRARRAERDEAERALRESEERSRQMAESLPQLVWTCRPDGRCDYLSPQWEQYTGAPAAENLDYGWAAFVHPDNRASLIEVWRGIVDHGTMLDVAFRLRRYDGVYRWFRARAAPLRGGDGRVVKWFGTNTDIDEAKHAEEQLRTADRRKDEFLAMLGHELRNPLSAISNAVKLWNSAPSDTEAEALARGVIERQTTNLTRLVDDLLDVARISEGKIELRKAPVELDVVVARAVEAVRPLVEERRHQLDLSLSGWDKIRVEADPTRLEQIVINLVTNAAKYTPDGGRITVVVRQERRDAVISVMDNGIGIPAEMLSAIFELFTQGERGLARTVGGLGIGLSLCRQLVELHGGSISVHSNGRGEGASFTIRLPLLIDDAPLPVSKSPVASPRAVRGRRVLLVDDNRDTVHSFARLLKLRGHEVATAYDGLAAIERAREFKPDIFLLDIGLPGLDGYALARRLREEGFADTPMIAISGYAQQGDRERAREAGFDRHFSKPINFEALAALLLAETSEIRAARAFQ